MVYETFASTLKGLKESADKLKEQNRRLILARQEWLGKIQTAEQHLKDLNQERQALTSEHEELDADRKAVSEILSSLKQKLGRKNESRQSLEQEITALRGKIEKFREKEKRLRQDRTLLEEKIAPHQKKVQSFEGGDSPEGLDQELQAAANLLEAVRQRVEGKQGRLDDLKKTAGPELRVQEDLLKQQEVLASDIGSLEAKRLEVEIKTASGAQSLAEAGASKEQPEQLAGLLRDVEELERQKREFEKIFVEVREQLRPYDLADVEQDLTRWESRLEALREDNQRLQREWNAREGAADE